MDREKYENLARALQKSPLIDVTFSAHTALVLIGYLQLVLRHPGAAAFPEADVPREFIRKLTELMPPESWPLIQRGFDPRYDEPAGENPERQVPA